MPPKRKKKLGQSIRVEGWDGMLAALDRIGDLPKGQMEHWDQAMERFYDRSQQLVHVDSVNLKRSGRFDPSIRVAHRAIGELVYGGRFGVDYAVYEFARGGSHDATQRAMNQVSATFARTLGDMIVDAAKGV
jgi:hypothetical protein